MAKTYKGAIAGDLILEKIIFSMNSVLRLKK